MIVITFLLVLEIVKKSASRDPRGNHNIWCGNGARDAQGWDDPLAGDGNGSELHLFAIEFQAL
jgi:hypothetical protein